MLSVRHWHCTCMVSSMLPLWWCNAAEFEIARMAVLAHLCLQVLSLQGLQLRFFLLDILLHCCKLSLD